MLSDYMEERAPEEPQQNFETAEQVVEEPVDSPSLEAIEAHPGEIPASFYDAEYFTAGTKSNYKPYSAGVWARRLARLIHETLQPASVLEVGCAYGYVVSILRQRGVDAYGFDVSEFAIKQSAAPDHTWVGSAEEPSSYRLDSVDLIVSTEMLEHLSERQIRLFLDNAKIAKRMVLLFGIEGGEEMHEDDGHVTFQPKEWWERLFADHGWVVGDASAFNEAPISHSMRWSGRFFVLSR